MRSTKVANRYLRLKTHYRSPEVAAHYDENLFRNRRFQTVNQQQLAALRRLIDHAAGEGGPIRRVLDLPCGTGRLFPELAEYATEIVGCDIALPMLIEAEKKACLSQSGSPRLLVGNAECLPFADGSFDAVVSCRFLRHIPRALRIAMMREMARVTRGWVIVDPRSAWHRQYVEEFVRGALSIPWRLPNYGLTRGGLARELRAASLRLERIERPYPGACGFLALARRERG
jgi:ubiquinone/menaquinone biosynthesis C-methylase UbiE